MRFFNLVAILGVVAVSADFDDEIARNLRGSELEDIEQLEDNEELEDDEDRNLASLTAKSIAFSFYKESGPQDDFCFNVRSFCKEYVDGHTFAYADGTLAFALEELYIESQCRVLSLALAKSFWCVSAQGRVDMKVTQQDDGPDHVSLDVQLMSSTMTVSLAATKAKADAYATGNAWGFTALTEFCEGAGKNSLLCVGSVTGVQTLGVADAESFAGAYAAAGAGALTYTGAFVDTWGGDISYLGAVLVTYALNWSFAEAAATAKAMAKAYVKTHNKSFNKMCLKTFKKKCQKKKFLDAPVCKKPSQQACDEAVAIGAAHGNAFAKAYASACALAVAATKLVIVMHAGIWKRGDHIWMGFGEEDETVGVAAATAICPGYRYDPDYD